MRLTLCSSRYYAILEHLEKLGIRNVVDCGCGGGEAMEYWCCYEWLENVVLVDRDREVIQRARVRWGEEVGVRERQRACLSERRGKRFRTGLRVSGWDGDVGRYDADLARHLEVNKVNTAILCEVIEHSPREAALETLRTLILQYGMEHVIVTTPNRACNYLYGLGEGEFRHSDHHWEPNQEEFKQFVSEVTTGLPFKMTTVFFGCGEPTEHGQPSQGVILTRGPFEVPTEVISSDRCVFPVFSYYIQPIPVPQYALTYVESLLAVSHPNPVPLDEVNGAVIDFFASHRYVLSQDDLQSIEALLASSENLSYDTEKGTLSCFPCEWCNNVTCVCYEHSDDCDENAW